MIAGELNQVACFFINLIKEFLISDFRNWSRAEETTKEGCPMCGLKKG
jgi:hypothetical protein